jgi:predicted esterase YcpF (UPF0227 family)
MHTIVYFHGYGSSSKTDKVDRIRKRFPDCKVLAFDASINPDVAKREVGHKITMSLVDDHSDDELIFIGTSLGAWLANELSDLFGCRAVLINPAYDPSTSLDKLGVDQDILDLYTPMNLSGLKRKSFYVDMEDDVIDHRELLANLDTNDITFYNGVGHRFNGKEFDEVLDRIL